MAEATDAVDRERALARLAERLIEDDGATASIIFVTERIFDANDADEVNRWMELARHLHERTVYAPPS